MDQNDSKEVTNGGESDDCRKLQGNGKEHCTSTVQRKEKRRPEEESQLQSPCRRNSDGQEECQRLSIPLDGGGKCDGLKWDEFEVLGRNL